MLTALGQGFAASRTWEGQADGFWSNRTNWAGDLPPAPGDTVMFPASATRRTSTNDLPVGLTLSGLTFAGKDYVIYGNAIRLDGALANEATGSGTNVVEADLLLDEVQTFSCADVDQVLNVGGVISGAGGVLKAGAGRLEFNGNSPNLYSGPTTVSDGRLQLRKAAGVTAVVGPLIIGGPTDERR